MVPIQRETLLTGAVFVCIVATIFLFRELNIVRDQLNEIGTVSSRLVHHANSVSQAIAAATGPNGDDDEDEEEETEVKVINVNAAEEKASE